MKQSRMLPIVFALVAMIVFSLSAAAATTVVVTPANTQGWSTAGTQMGGAVNYVADPTAPGGNGALQLTTDANPAAKAQYLHEANTPLASVAELSYYAKQNSASFVGGDPSYQLVVCLGGGTATTCNGFTTLVYEPYENGVVVPGAWQSWDVDAGQFWSSRTVTVGSCSVVAGAGGPPYYTLAGLKAACPNAVVTGFGVNIGTYNPSYDVLADLVSFNGTSYDFELTNLPTDKDQCKKGGWQNYTNASGQAFKNQGDCVSYVATGGKND